MYVSCQTCRLASVDILGKEREPGVGKLGWHGNFDTGFERNTSHFVQNPVCGFFELFRNSDCLLVYLIVCVKIRKKYVFSFI